MNNRISLKTDASYSPEGEIGIGYTAKFDGETFTGSGYSARKCSSTEAEMMATAWSVHNLSERIDADLSDYVLVVQTDCQHTVNKFDGGFENREMRVINHYADVYDKMMMFWIPRECNEQADSIAKTMLDKGQRQ